MTTLATLRKTSNSVSQRRNVCQVSAKRLYLRRHPPGTGFKIRAVASSAIYKYSSQHLRNCLSWCFFYMSIHVLDVPQLCPTIAN